MDCQLMGLPPAGVKLPLPERLRVIVNRSWRRLRDGPLLQAAAPSRPRTPRPDGAPLAHGAEAPAPSHPRRRPASLRLQPGELVRIKAPEAIRATLDQRGRCRGLPYMDNVMDPYCGSTRRVKKRVDRFFDESRWRLLRLRNVVILEGVFCEPSAQLDEDWAGCKRTCHLFWKEAWLERIGA